MKKLTTLCLAGCLAAALATPAGALDYTIDAPEGPDSASSPRWRWYIRQMVGP